MLEVVLTSGGIDELNVYRGLDVREVWFFEEGRFHLHELGADGYHPIDRSALIPDLDFDELAELVALDDQHEAVQTYRDRLRAR